MEEIKTGHVVELKSGGIKMTVRSTDGDRIYVNWFNDGILHSQWFHKNQLKKI